MAMAIAQIVRAELRVLPATSLSDMTFIMPQAA
jgi:hypothetical protein